MKHHSTPKFFVVFYTLFLCLLQSIYAEGDPLPTWNDGPAKQAIIEFVDHTCDKSSPDYVPPEQRIATFDQDGTLLVEQPMYTQVVYSLEHISVIAKQNPELQQTEPFKAILSGDRAVLTHLSMTDLEKIVSATMSGMSVEDFGAQVKNWLAAARHPRWNKPYTELVYQPMLNLLQYLRLNSYKTYIVSGSGQDFIRVYAEQVYGIPPEQVVGTMRALKYEYNQACHSFLIKEPALVLRDNFEGKPEGIYFMIGRRPYAAFGNSSGDQQMLEYTSSGNGKRLMMLVMHDDAAREYAYGPAQGLPDSQVGTFPQTLYDNAKKCGWIVISMKNDWKQIFSFEK